MTGQDHKERNQLIMRIQGLKDRKVVMRGQKDYLCAHCKGHIPTGTASTTFSWEEPGQARYWTRVHTTCELTYLQDMEKRRPAGATAFKLPDDPPPPLPNGATSADLATNPKAFWDGLRLQLGQKIETEPEPQEDPEDHLLEHQDEEDPDEPQNSLNKNYWKDIKGAARLKNQSTVHVKLVDLINEYDRLSREISDDRNGNKEAMLLIAQRALLEPQIEALKWVLSYPNNISP